MSSTSNNRDSVHTTMTVSNDLSEDMRQLALARDNLDARNAFERWVSLSKRDFTRPSRRTCPSPSPSPPPHRTKSGIKVSSPHYSNSNPPSALSSPMNSISSSTPAANGQPQAQQQQQQQSHTQQQPQQLSAFKRNPAQHRKSVFVIGVAGGTASGKTTVCEMIMQRLHDQCVVMLSQDSFYRGLTPDEKSNVQDYNFDHPDAFDTAYLMDCITRLKNRLPVEVPEYDFTTHARASTSTHVTPADVVIIEGILVLHMEDVRNECHMKIFVDTDDDVRLARRIQRDVAARGRDVAGVIEQYTRFVKPAFDQFVAPSRRHADVIIPWQRGDNLVAIDLITDNIRSKLQQPDLLRIYPNLHVIPSNFQIRGMHTLVRDRDTGTEDFVFYADRLLRLVVEHGLGMLPFREKAVVTPTEEIYTGVEFAKKLCGVSVIRSGESMENALRDCCKGIKLGKILVHRVGDRVEDSEAQADCIIYERLPLDIADRYVLLMDPILGTGSSASRAIRVLLDKGVQEQHIIFLTLIAAPEGVHTVCKRYPGIQVVTSEIDECIDGNYRVSPGVGDFGNRYFGTAGL